MIFLQNRDGAVVIREDVQLVKYPMDFPPPDGKKGEG